MPARSGPSLDVDFSVLAGGFVLFLGLGMLGFGIGHAFSHGTCSTTGYSRYYGPVPHCAKGIGWWAGMIILGIFVALGGLGIIGVNSGETRSRASIVGGLLAGAVGVGAAFGISAGVNSAIGKQPAPAPASVAGSGVTYLTPAQVRANRVQICKDLVSGNKLLSTAVHSYLTSQCQADPAAAEKRLRVEAKAAGLAFAAKQCKQGVAGASGLPASAQATLSSECGAATKAGGAPSAASVKATTATACQQIVKAQVPAAYQATALAACPKP